MLRLLLSECLLFFFFFLLTVGQRPHDPSYFAPFVKRTHSPYPPDATFLFNCISILFYVTKKNQQYQQQRTKRTNGTNRLVFKY